MESFYQTKEYFDAYGLERKIYEVNGRSLPFAVSENGTIKIFANLTDFSFFSQPDVTEFFHGYNVKKITAQDLRDLPERKIKKAVISESHSENIIDLSSYSSFDEYFSSLGTKTRHHLKNYRTRLNKYLTENGLIFETVILRNENTDTFRGFAKNIYDLNEDRCLRKGFHSGAEKELIEVAAKIGGLIVYLVNGKVVAGTFFTLFNEELCLHTIAHDSSYNSFNVGNLVLLDTIEYAFKCGARCFNLMWGEQEYKKRFGTESHRLYNIVIYKRSIPYFFGKAYQIVIDVKNRIISSLVRTWHYINNRCEKTNADETRKRN